MPIGQSRDFLLTVFALTAAALLLSGCQQETPPWAEITVDNSNGQQATISCQERTDCPELAAALAGNYRPIFLYPLRRKDRRDGRYRQYRLGQLVVPGRPELLPRLAVTSGDRAEGDICYIIRWGPERLRVRGQVAGKPVEVTVTRTDSCEEDQYLLWNIFAPTDRLLDKNTALAKPPSRGTGAR